jgi:hypothetical protein
VIDHRWILGTRKCISFSQLLKVVVQTPYVRLTQQFLHLSIFHVRWVDIDAHWYTQDVANACDHGCSTTWCAKHQQRAVPRSFITSNY